MGVPLGDSKKNSCQCHQMQVLQLGKLKRDEHMDMLQKARGITTW